MDKNYYTPDIEEFHVGFEYEVRNELKKDSWNNYHFDNKFLPLFTSLKDKLSIKNEIENRNIRVKYLDKEDIEDLGFEHLGNDRDIRENNGYSFKGKEGYLMYFW